jgi:hypothetical protein
MTAFHRIAERCQVKSTANTSSATRDSLLATHLPRVSVDRCDTDKGSDTASIKLAEFGQIGDQGVRSDIADTWN